MRDAVVEKDRFLKGLRALVRSMLPRVEFFGFYRYTVVEQQAEFYSCQPVNRKLGIPTLVRVKARSGVAGAYAALHTGCEVLVGFADGDPAQPFVGHFPSFNDPFWKPEEVHVNASSMLYIGKDCDHVRLTDGTSIPPPIDPRGRVVRIGDEVTIGTTSGVIIAAGDVSRVTA